MELLPRIPILQQPLIRALQRILLIPNRPPRTVQIPRIRPIALILALHAFNIQLERAARPHKLLVVAFEVGFRIRRP